MNDKITFGDNINKTGKSAECQVNAFVPIKSFLLLKERDVLVSSCLYQSSCYCPPVWML